VLGGSLITVDHTPYLVNQKKVKENALIQKQIKCLIETYDPLTPYSSTAALVDQPPSSEILPATYILDYKKKNLSVKRSSVSCYI
jgi:hypothetical protein